MRSIIALITVLLLALPAVAMADFCSADDPDDFTEGDLTYRIIEGNDVEIVELDEDYEDEDLTIESTVVHNAVTYDIVALNVYFETDKIHTIHLPQSIVKINDGCFSMLPMLESIEVNAFNSNFSSVDGVLFEKKNGVENKLIKCPMNKGGTEYISIPGTVSEIGSSAFSGTGFTTIKLNDGLIKISTAAFDNCFDLENLRCNLGDHMLPSTVSNIGSFAFENCRSLKQLTLSEELEYIGPSAFYCSGLTSVNIPVYVDFIGIGAFANCSDITKFTSNNFSYPADDDGVLYSVGKNDTKTLFAFPASSNIEKYTIPEDVTDVNSYSFSGCKNLKEIVLNNHFTTIPEQAFSDCKSLEKIDISNIISIGMSAFNGCESLSDIEFGSNLTTIDDGAFINCNLQNIFIPANVLYIGYNTFTGCKQLKEVTIEEGSKVRISASAFGGCKSIEKISIQSGDVVLSTYSLAISYYESEPYTLNVEVVKGYVIPDDAANEYTELNITVIGERPYPWENWIGVFFCALVVIGILWAVREV